MTGVRQQTCYSFTQQGKKKQKNFPLAPLSMLAACSGCTGGKWLVSQAMLVIPRGYTSSDTAPGMQKGNDAAPCRLSYPGCHEPEQPLKVAD